MYRDPSSDQVAADIRRQDKLVADSLDWFREVALQEGRSLALVPAESASWDAEIRSARTRRALLMGYAGGRSC